MWQVLAIYLVGSRMGYEVILELTDGVGLPDWVPPFAIVLFIIGLPIVLATALVQEGLPGESDRAESTAAVPEPSEPDARASAASPTAAPDPGSGREGAGWEDAPQRLLTWPRAITAGVLAFALLGLAATGFLGMRALGIGPVGTLVAKGELEAREPLHPYFQQTALQHLHAKHGILTQAWSPIGGITAYRDYGKSVFEDPTLNEIGRKHDRSPAQVMLRWHLQEGRSAIPKSEKAARITENFGVFDFELSTDEIAAIDALDVGVRGGSEPEDITLENFGREIPEA